MNRILSLVIHLAWWGTVIYCAAGWLCRTNVSMCTVTISKKSKEPDSITGDPSSVLMASHLLSSLFLFVGLKPRSSSRSWNKVVVSWFGSVSVKTVAVEYQFYPHWRCILFQKYVPLYTVPMSFLVPVAYFHPTYVPLLYPSHCQDLRLRRPRHHCGITRQHLHQNFTQSPLQHIPPINYCHRCCPQYHFHRGSLLHLQFKKPLHTLGMGTSPDSSHTRTAILHFSLRKEYKRTYDGKSNHIGANDALLQYKASYSYLCALYTPVHIPRGCWLLRSLRTDLNDSRDIAKNGSCSLDMVRNMFSIHADRTSLKNNHRHTSAPLNGL